jgi:ATP-dependent Clp protease ATP-binding subunit ClpC
MESVVFTPCNTCSGTGTIPEGVCTTCLGSGQLITIGSTQATYSIPALIQPGSATHAKVATTITVAAGILTTAVSLGSLGKLAAQSWPNLAATFWQPGIFSALFGVSGLASMCILATALHNKTTERSLTTLIADLGAGGTVSLNQYTSSRLKNLLSQTVVDAGLRGAEVISAEDIILTLCEQPRIQMMLARLEISPMQVVDEVKQLVRKSAESHHRALPVAQSGKLLLLQAIQEAISNQFPFADLEDVFLAYLKYLPTETMGTLSISYKKFLAVSTWYAADETRSQRWKFWAEQARSHPKGYMNRAWTALPTPLLDSVGKDLTLLASYGKMSDGTSREKELEITLQTLAGGSIKNVILIGEDGSGRSSIISAVATKILEDKVPDSLKDKRLVELDLNQLLTKEGGSSNLQVVIEEVQQAGNVILSIPDIKTLAGDGEALDGSTILAGALKNNVIQVITTANYSDFHRYVEQNSSLKSQLQTVELHQLEPAEVLPILEAYTGKLEAQYDLAITYPALEAAANLAPRYLSEQPAPAGAKQILEAACKQSKNAGRSWVRKTDVEAGIESIVQVPVSQASGKEAETLLNLEATLHERIIGQNVAVVAVAEALRRARAGLRGGNRPLGSFLFVGPTGVGKTELAKALCESYFGPEAAMLRFDMSEYQSAESVNTLIGTPETQGGTLTQAVREKPFSLVLFDELEKAHPDILNLFLQVLDDGRLTEASGRTATFTNTIIIATSNAQARSVGEAVQQGADTNAVMQLLEANFRPEFLNRFDGIVPFMPLTPEEITRITSLLCDGIIAKAAEKGISLSVAPDALARLAELGFDPLYGARPLRRVVEQKIEGILARLLLEQQIAEGSSLQITRAMID